MKRELDPAVYRRAAAQERILYSCNAINFAVRDMFGPGLHYMERDYVHAYEQMFKPNPALLTSYGLPISSFTAWLDVACNAGHIQFDELDGWRRTALCFMAAIVEQEADDASQ